MIKYNSNTINDWNFGTSNLIKVYRNNAIVFYKVSGTPPSPTSQTPCFAVVDDISQYQEIEFEDVFNNVDGKWYKLNNLNQYEEYGVYGSGRTGVTTYEGKLTIDDGYEYQYIGGSWVNLGEVSGSTRLPQGYTEVEYVENTTQAYINTNLVLLENVGDSFEIKLKTYFTPYSNDFEYLFGTEKTSSPYTGIQLRYYQRNLQYNGDSNVVWTHIDNGDGTSGVTASCSSINATNGGNPLTLFCGLWSTGPWRFGRGKIYSFTVTKNNSIVRDLVPCKRDSDSKYGMYDIVGGSFYISPNSYLLSGGSATTDIVYPLYYDEKQDPPNNVSFSSMTEAEEYECPWVGMTGIISNTDYIFDENYDWVTKYQWTVIPNVYICYDGDKYAKEKKQIRNVDDSWTDVSPAEYQRGSLIESASTDCYSRLPQGYTEVEYVQNYANTSVGTSYLAFIDTNFKPNQDTRIVMTMKCDKSNNYSRFCGAGRYDKINAIQFDYESGAQGTLHISWGAKSSWSTYSSCVGDYNIHKYDWNKNYFYRDKGTANEFSTSTAYTAFQCTDNLGIFTNISNGYGELNYNVLYGRLYSCQIYDNGTLIRDFVPCINPNNVVGVYDIVNNVFYQSGNGNSFVAGPEV